MRFNVQLPLKVDVAGWLRVGALPEAAGHIETAGFDAVSVTDHPFPPVAWLRSGGHHAFDPFVALSFLAAGSERIRLLTNILVLPYRHPVTTAKALATLDALSGGRLIVGTAVGYLREEFDALGVDFESRAATFDSTLERMVATWASTGDGRGERGIAGHEMWPAPAQQPRPPLWVGGNSAMARRRAVAHADGWMPFGQTAATAAVTGTPALETVDDLAAAVARLDEERVAAGRPHPLDVLFAPARTSALTRRGAGEAEMADEVAAYEAAGVTWLNLTTRAEGPHLLPAELERWAHLLG